MSIIAITAPWMGKEFRTALAAFVEGQQAMLDPKDDTQQEWLNNLVQEMNLAENLYQAWMTPSVFCWVVIQDMARKNTAKLRRYGTKALILVKAQHPLREDGTPGNEYQVRLCRAMEVGEMMSSRFNDTSTYMVVGGKHAGSEVTLADAGACYLRSSGRTNIIRRVDIFSGNDEDWVACDEFLNDSSYSDLFIVGSTGQFARSYMACLMKGIVPRHELVSFAAPHQDPILELSGPWSVGGYFEKGPMELKRAAIETARRHKEEAEAK